MAPPTQHAPDSDAPVASMGEALLHFMDDDEEESSMDDRGESESEGSDMDDDIDVVESRKSICFDKSLLELAAIRIPHTCRRKNCKGSVEVSTKHIGCAVRILWVRVF